MAIVAAVDRSGRAEGIITEAWTLADAFDVPLKVVHVMTQSEFIELEQISLDETGSVVNLDDVRKVAADFAEDAISKSDATAEAVGLVGDVTNEILRYADDQDALYIVTGGRKRSAVGKAIFGSTTQSILLNADRPVVTVIE